MAKIASKRVYFATLVALGALTTIYHITKNKTHLHNVEKVEKYYEKMRSLSGGDVLGSTEVKSELERYSRLPDIIGIGTEKCGSGALQFFLRHHPLVRGHKIYKETHFFTEKVSKNNPIDLELYKKYLANATDEEYIMEKTPAYFNFRPSDNIPGRIKRSVPYAKIWLVLCDPANRVYSDFIHEKNTHVLKQDWNFTDYILPRIEYEKRLLNNINLEDREVIEYIRGRMERFYPSHIILTGLYYYHLQQWFKYYSKRQLIIVDGENLIKNPYEEVKKVEKFIGLPEVFKEEHFVVNQETGFYCMKMNQENESELSCLTGRKGNTRMKENLWVENNSTIQHLKEFYKPYNNKLFKYINRTFNW